MAELRTPASKSEGPAFDATVASRGFPPLQLIDRTKNANHENACSRVTKNRCNFLTPFLFLQEVVDDEIGSQVEMCAPASMRSAKQSPRAGTELKPQPGLPIRLRCYLTFFDIFPPGSSIVWHLGYKARGVSTSKTYEADRVKLVRHQKKEIVECYPSENGITIASCQVGKMILQRPAKR